MRVLSVSRLGQLPWLLAVVVTSVLLPHVAEASFKLTSGGNTIEDGDGGEGTTWWKVYDTSALGSNDVETKVGAETGVLDRLYKADFDNNEESGGFENSYTTLFEPLDDDDEPNGFESNGMETVSSTNPRSTWW